VKGRWSGEGSPACKKLRLKRGGGGGGGGRGGGVGGGEQRGGVRRKRCLKYRTIIDVPNARKNYEEKRRKAKMFTLIDGGGIETNVKKYKRIKRSIS